MMEQFSWQAFWTACLAVNLIWYAAVLLLFYRKELQNFLKKGSVGDEKATDVRSSKRTPTQQTGDGFESKSASSVQLMGQPKLPQGVEVISSNQVSFLANEQGRYDQVGLVADVVQELKDIFSKLEKQAGSKADFFKMLEQVKEDYGSISGHPSIGNINDFIRQSAPFHISDEELENLWY